MDTTKNAVIGKLNRLGYISGQPTSTFAERIQALHDKLDAVIDETKGVRMYVPRLAGMSFQKEYKQ